MPEKILIIEDEKPIAEILRYGLKKAGYDVYTAYRGAEGFQTLLEIRPDLLILDWMLPDIDGVDICRMVTEQINVPIIMLTAKGTMDDKLTGLSAGADDYITKPFDLREVILRVQAILRRMDRVQRNAEEPEKYAGDITLYRAEHRVTSHGETVTLTPKEYELLVYMLDNPKRAFSRDQLLEHVWGYDYAGDTRTVDIHIQRLRKKLGLSDHLVTVYGVGYRYSPEGEGR